MRITLTNGIRFIEPDDGKILTNGEVYSDGVYLAINANVDDWTEVDRPPEMDGETDDENGEESTTEDT